jgi:anaerobic magnesium-protoporphyrin IX monomethyl ester cyclase
MVDVLLAHAYFLKNDPKQWQKMRPYPPLATLYAAAHVRQAGVSVALFDAMLAEGEHEFALALAQYQPRIVALYDDNFNFLSKMCLARVREAAATMSRMARDYGAVVLAAGSDASDHPEAYFAHGVQAVLVGEPDHTLREVVAVLLEREGEGTGEQGDKGTRRQRIVVLSASDASGLVALSSTPGLALPDPAAPNGIHYTARRPVERHPDVFPMPAWDLVDTERYRAAWTQAHGYWSLNMVSTRGCPFHCNWCAKPIWGQRYAMRSPASVADELAFLKRTYQPDHIWFADDIFGLRPQWVAAFGQAVAERDAALPFMIQSRVDLMTDEAVAGLKQAGCVEVWMGAESGSQQILDAMEKGTRVEEIAIARARLKAAGIRACYFIQFGYPGETYADILATVQLVRDTLPDNIGVSVSYPLPGTRFYDMVRDQLGPKTHWEDSDDLAMMFAGTYGSRFYRHLHRLLHHELELRQGMRDSKLEIDQLAADWFTLGQLEVSERSPAPTLLPVRKSRIKAPDLSKEYN